MISLDDTKRITTTTSPNSHPRIGFNLMIHIQQLVLLNFWESWSTRKSFPSSKLGLSFTKLSHIPTTPYFLRLLKNGRLIWFRNFCQGIWNSFIMLIIFILNNWEQSIQEMTKRSEEWVSLKKATQRRFEWHIFLLFAHMLSTVLLLYTLSSSERLFSKSLMLSIQVRLETKLTE